MSDHILFFVGTTLILMGTFWIGVAIYTWFDKKKLFARYKIQPNKYAPAKLVKKAARSILINQTFILLPLIFLT
ncbi:MAG: hypothetical protein M3Q07_05915 [Pseudobdellovibrionaceae bacterium]|nr:hypothetical protein [Pseudobdellovibrionaceae bacterium]